MSNRALVTQGVLGVVASVMWMGVAGAAVISANTSSYGSQSAFAASGTDLINAGQATLAGVSNVYNVDYGSSSAFNDGTASGGACALTTGNEIGATFTLDTSVNTKGYDISSIVALAGWNDSRANQNIRISYHVVGEASGVYHTLGTYLNDAATGGDYSTKITIYNDQGGYIMTGVDQVIFAALGGYGTMVTEWDVFGGAAPIPEPAALGLLALGSVLLTRRRIAG